MQRKICYEKQTPVKIMAITLTTHTAHTNKNSKPTKKYALDSLLCFLINLKKISSFGNTNNR